MIAGIASVLPPLRRTSAEVEALIVANGVDYGVPAGVVSTATGIRERRVAGEGVYAPDLAAEAARAVPRKASTAPEEVDLLIYASAG